MALGNVGSMAVALLGDMKDFDRKMDGATKKVSTFDKTVGKMGKAVTKAAKLAAAAAATAVVAFGASAVKTFVEFDTEMRNVFTLMPDLSAEAREAMEEDVKALAEQIGVLPNEVIPALYQALSAGVPQENVFEYMAVAGETAIGGTIALEDAVVGLAQVMNAYGAEVDTVRDYSDIMFSIVRDGITTMEELSGELFKVAPVAADLGIAFSSIAGWAAELTSQGVPTAEAFSYMKVALNELSKTGTIASDTFEKAAGVTFPAFIDAGGDLAGAFEIIDDYASDAGISVKDMFGSIEAGGAVLQATGVHFDSFTKKVNNAEEAGGNTRAAYEEMAAGVRHELDKLAVWWQNLKLDIGGDLTENLQDLLGWLKENQEAIGDGMKAVFDGIVDGLAWLKDNGTAVKNALIAISVGLAAIAIYTNPLLAVAAAIGAIVFELNKADTSTLTHSFDTLRESVSAFLALVDQTDQGDVTQFLNNYRAAVLKAGQDTWELGQIGDDVYTDFVNQVLALDEAVWDLDTEKQVTAFMDGADAILLSVDALKIYASTSIDANTRAAEAAARGSRVIVEALEDERDALGETSTAVITHSQIVAEAIEDEREARSSLTADEIAALDASMAAKTAAIIRHREEVEAWNEKWKSITTDTVADVLWTITTALADEEATYEETRTKITGIIKDGFNDMVNAIVRSGIDSATEWVVDQLWIMATEAELASAATSTALGGILLPLTAIAGTLTVLSDLISGKSTGVQGLNKWLTNLIYGAGTYEGNQFGNVTVTPNAPGFADGGIVPGPIGSPMNAVVHGGEEVSTPEQQAARGIDYELLGQVVTAGYIDAITEMGGTGSSSSSADLRTKLAQLLYDPLQVEAERRGGTA